MMLSLMSFTYARKLQGAMAMKIDPDRLLSLRKKQGWSRPQLAKRSGITVRTIQRLESESESQRGQKSQEHTVDSLAKALGVESGVLTGELPLPESGKVPVSDTERVQIGAQIAPKVRLAYDLIRRRYGGVSATEIINLAPLFFAILAEGSLAWRREKLKELKEGIDRLEEIDGFWHGRQGLPFAVTPVPEAIEAEEESIAKADLFGEHLLGCMTYDLDPSTDNPFASYLRRLKAELDIPSVVDVDSGDLMFGSPLKFPDYDICRDELDGIANGSPAAQVALEASHARLSEIPEKLMAEDAGEERAKWLGDKLSDAFKGLEKEIKDLEKGMKDLEKEIKEKDDRIEEMGRPETYPEGVSDEEVWRERFKESMKEREKQNERREKLDHLKKKHREKRGRLEMLITEEKGRSTSLNGIDPEADSKDIEGADSQETNSDMEKGGDDQ